MSQTKIEEIKKDSTEGDSIPSFTSIGDSADSYLKKCYSCSNEDAFKYFSYLQAFIKESLIDGMENGQFDIFDTHFFEKLYKISIRSSAIKQVEAAKLLVEIFSHDEIVSKFFQDNKHEGLFTDYINHFLTLLEKFDHLPITNRIGDIARKLFQYVLKEDLFKEQRTYFQSLISHEKFNPAKITVSEKVNFKNFLLMLKQSKDIEKVIALSTSSDINMKKEIPAIILAILDDTKTFNEQIKVFIDKVGPYLKEIMVFDNGTEEQIQSFLGSMIMLVEKFIFQLEFSISFERNGIYETKLFTVKEEKNMIIDHPALLKCVATVLNPVLLRPFEINLQQRAFYIIRRLYYLYPEYSENIINPLNLVLSNISVYGSPPNDLKEATIFLYRATHKEDEEDENLKKLVENNENLKFLKENKYYSIKALSYPRDIDNIWQLRNLNIEIGLPVKVTVEAGKVFTLSLYIEDTDSIIYWKFRVKNHNIRFGIYKFHTLENINYNNLENEDPQKYQEIVKLQKVESSVTYVTGSTLITSPGYYKVIFDNGFSYWRQKELEFNIHALQSH